MAVTSEVSADGSKLTIAIKGRFDFAKHQEFRDAYEELSPAPACVVVDLKEATYLDSSALGMLLLLKERVGTKPIILSNAKGTVKSVLEIANFHQLFTMK